MKLCEHKDIYIMIKIENKNNEILLSFPQHLISSQYLQSVIERLEMEAVVQKSSMSETDAWNLSEELKSNWWEKNRDNILKRIED